MTKADKLKIAAVIIYMLNPLGILAFASQASQNFAQDKKISRLIARHNFQAPQALVKASPQNEALHQKRSSLPSRAPASVESAEYSCMRRTMQ